MDHKLPLNKRFKLLKLKFPKHFDTSDKGVLERYLAINVYYGKGGDRDDEGVIYISQYDYGEKILTRFGLENCKSVAAPMNEKQALIPRVEGTATKVEIHEFQTNIGTMIWLMVSTRPDISFIVIKLAKHAMNPGYIHLQVLKRVFRYLSGTKHLSISFAPGDDALSGYYDTD